MVLGKRKLYADVDTHDQYEEHIFASPLDDVCQSTKRMRLDFSPASPLHMTINFVDGSCIDSKPTMAPSSLEILDDNVSVVEEQHDYYRNKELIQHHKRSVEVNTRLPQAYEDRHRGTCAGWLSEVQDESKLSALPVHMSVLLMDRFLSIEPTFPKQRYQLLAATCFWVSAKREELEEYVPTLEDMVLLCAGQFARTDFVTMENYLLNTLQWEIAEVTPIHFLDYYLQHSTSAQEQARVSSDQLMSCAEFLIDLGLHDRRALQKFVPSQIAAAALVTARAVLGLSPSSEGIERVSRYKFTDLRECFDIMYTYYHKLQDEGQ